MVVISIGGGGGGGSMLAKILELNPIVDHSGSGFCVQLRITLRILVCHGCGENLISVLDTITDIKICSLQL